MKIIVTGSLGHISKPLTQKLVEKGHSVTVISHSPERQKGIEAVGAIAAIGSVEDVEFLTDTFTGADAVYCMMPFNVKEPNQIAWLMKISNNYALSIQKAGIKRVVVLSGWVAGVFRFYRDIENILNGLPDISVTYIRPGSFYSNFFDFTEMIKEKNLIAAAYGGEDKIVMSSPYDIAEVIADEITRLRQSNKFRYVVSDEMTCSEAAKIIGAAIGKPHLKWMALTDKEIQKGMEGNGLSPNFASTMVEMQTAIHNGLMIQEFSRHRSEVIMGEITLKDFAKEFAAIYNQQ